MKRRCVAFALVAFVFALSGSAAETLTADEVLDRMEAEADRVAEGSLVAVIRFDNAYADGSTVTNRFGSLSKPKRSLICFLEPEDVAGTVFLTHEPESDGESARLWLYLPLLGLPKELVSDDERGGSFAGSALSYEDIGQGDRRSDYTAELIEQTSLAVGGQTRAAYVIESVLKPGIVAETSRTILWVDSEFFTLLKMEAYNDLGRVASTMEVVALGAFEGRIVGDSLLAVDVASGNRTTVTFESRHRPDSDIPESAFAPENLGLFEPAAWGF
jgi:hypothetical protein